jgi:hypothetical protein
MIAKKSISHEKPFPESPVLGLRIVEQLKADGFIGLWSRRRNLPESPVFARRLREEAERREYEPEK